MERWDAKAQQQFSADRWINQNGRATYNGSKGKLRFKVSFRYSGRRMRSEDAERFVTWRLAELLKEQGFLRKGDYLLWRKLGEVVKLHHLWWENGCAIRSNVGFIIDRS
jgi:hypothetical protein